MKDNTKPPEIGFEPDVDVELDSTKEMSGGANGHEIPTETYRTVHDWSENRSLSTTVVHAVERVLGTPGAELPPLYEHVDPDGLDSIFASVQSDHVRTEGRITFPYAGLRVMIQADGTITLSIAPEEGEV